MAWIESHQELASHPKTRRLASCLGVSVPAAIGHLHLLWWWALDYADDGALAGLEADEIAFGAQWDGDPQQLMAALVKAGFVDDDLTIHDWWTYAGRYVAGRQANAERMRKARAAAKAAAEAARKAKRAPDEPDTYKERAAHVQRTSGARAPATVPNQTKQNNTNGATTNPSRVDAGSRESRADVMAVALAEHDPVDVLYRQLEPLIEHGLNAEAQRRLWDVTKDILAGTYPGVTADNALGAAQQWHTARRPSIDTPTGRVTSLGYWFAGQGRTREGPQNGHSPPPLPAAAPVTPDDLVALRKKFGDTYDDSRN